MKFLVTRFSPLNLQCHNCRARVVSKLRTAARLFHDLSELDNHMAIKNRPEKTLQAVCRSGMKLDHLHLLQDRTSNTRTSYSMSNGNPYFLFLLSNPRRGVAAGGHETQLGPKEEVAHPHHTIARHH
jgi:hypothetical protein